MTGFMSTRFLLVSFIFTLGVRSHIAPWHPALYQCGGDTDPQNTRPVDPLYNKTKNDWWFHGTECRNNPPPAGTFLNLPAGGSFTVELSGNKHFTTLVQGGKFTSQWPDGRDHPEGYNGFNNTGGQKAGTNGCIVQPNIHTTSEQDAAGSAFAISYKSDINQVTIDDLTVFTTKANTPWKRVTTYQVPSDMPACPPDGCTCAWVWIPNHCGLSNMYMIGVRCRVTNVQSTARKIGAPKPPVWCEDDRTKCVKGPKQMVAAFQNEGNNVVLVGNQQDGLAKSPGYNLKMGFPDGAQNDIFE